MKIVKFYENNHKTDRLVVQWNIGNTCNYSCEYCPSILHRGDRPWVDLNLITTTILRIKERFPEKKLRLEFLGGEITLYKNFISLMQFCKDNDIKNMIFTNASRTFRHWNEVLPYLDEVLLTFHPQSADKQHFESIVELLYNNNSQFYIHLAMVKDLFQDTMDFGKYLQQKFSNLHITSTLMMDKENKKEYRGYFYDYSEEELNSVKKFDRGTEQYIAEYDNGESAILTLNEVKTGQLNKFKGYSCGNNENLICIDAFGNASSSLCRQKPKINIFNQSIDQLFTENICRTEICENPSDFRIIKILKNT